MLTTLVTVKTRLAIPEVDTQYDALLTAAIQAVSVRFDLECNRTLGRAENATCEFDPADTEILPDCYPIETVTRFEVKENESDGWSEVANVSHLLRNGCVISLPVPLNLQPVTCPLQPLLARVLYTGGYVLPGAIPPPPVPPATPLPADLEQAAVEQVAWWFQKRSNVGLKTYWPSGAAYQQFLQSDLLLEVRAALKSYTRFCL